MVFKRSLADMAFLLLLVCVCGEKTKERRKKKEIFIVLLCISTLSAKIENSSSNKHRYYRSTNPIFQVENTPYFISLARCKKEGLRVLNILLSYRVRSVYKKSLFHTGQVMRVKFKLLKSCNAQWEF